MISLIFFLNLKYLPLAEAERLKLSYTPTEDTAKVGYDYSDNLSINNTSYYYYSSDLFSDGSFFKDKELTQKVEKYYVIKPLSEKEKEKNYVTLAETHLVDLVKFIPECRYPFKVRKLIRSTSDLPIQSILLELEEKTNRLQKITGELMVTFNDLKLCTDICTDSLQEELNNGWRIIACCVQPNQRRSDYILGRFNPEKHCAEISAKRK